MREIKKRERDGGRTHIIDKHTKQLKYVDFFFGGVEGWAMAHGNLFPWQGIEPRPQEWKHQINHWIIREFSMCGLYMAPD